MPHQYHILFSFPRTQAKRTLQKSSQSQVQSRFFHSFIHLVIYAFFLTFFFFRAPPHAPSEANRVGRFLNLRNGRKVPYYEGRNDGKCRLLRCVKSIVRKARLPHTVRIIAKWTEIHDVGYTPPFPPKPTENRELLFLTKPAPPQFSANTLDLENVVDARKFESAVPANMEYR